jgi:TonB family protein
MRGTSLVGSAFACCMAVVSALAPCAFAIPEAGAPAPIASPSATPECGQSIEASLACLERGRQLVEGQGVARDFEQATAYFTAACRGGVTEGCYMPAQTMLPYLPDPKEAQKVVDLLERTCDEGQVFACFALGTARASTKAELRDDQKALKAFGGACSLGHAQGCLREAAIAGGGGIESDPAHTLVEKACRLGEDAACDRLCQAGEGWACEVLVNRLEELNPDKAALRAALEKACAAGNPCACQAVAPQDSAVTNSAEALQSKCDADDAQSCFKLAWARHRGETRAQDLNAARALFGQACEMGHRRACRCLAGMLARGEASYAREGKPDPDLMAACGLDKDCLKAIEKGKIPHRWGDGASAPNPAREKEPPKAELECGRRVRFTQPVYPPEARTLHLEGTVKVKVLCDATGRVVAILAREGHPALLLSASAAALEWAYAPALVDGLPAPMFMTVTVNFRLK